MRPIIYLATEFAGDPPAPVARWCKVQAGTYARLAEGNIDFFHQADLKVEHSLDTSIEFVAGDGSDVEIGAVATAWRVNETPGPLPAQ